MRSNTARAIGAAQVDGQWARAVRPLNYGQLVAEVTAVSDQRIGAASPHDAASNVSIESLDWVARFSVFAGYAALIAAFALTGRFLIWLIA